MCKCVCVCVSMCYTQLMVVVSVSGGGCVCGHTGHHCERADGEKTCRCVPEGGGAMRHLIIFIL